MLEFQFTNYKALQCMNAWLVNQIIKSLKLYPKKYVNRPVKNIKHCAVKKFMVTEIYLVY